MEADAIIFTHPQSLHADTSRAHQRQWVRGDALHSRGKHAVRSM